MAALKELTRTKGNASMSLAEIREQLQRFRREGKINPAAQARLEKKMRLIMGRLNKLGKRGGAFGQVQLSKELQQLCKRG